LRVAASRATYKLKKRRGCLVYEKSDMPIVVLIDGTAKPIRSEGALLQVIFSERGVHWIGKCLQAILKGG
jgi:hypothetical protein